MHSKKEVSTFDHFKAIIQLPFVVLVIIPSALWLFLRKKQLIDLASLPKYLTLSLGVLVLIIGLIVFIKSIDLFIKIGKGTLAPWNPTKKIVIKSLYRYVRNPMLIGVNLILLAEALLFQSGNILIWMFLFLIVNHLYFIKKEEPGLLKRFGQEYEEYCKHVPRWIPRIKGWFPEKK